MILTERYKDQIAGVLSCYDRVILQGTLPGWCYDKGMTEFLFIHKIRIFDYPPGAPSGSSFTRAATTGWPQSFQSIAFPSFYRITLFCALMISSIKMYDKFGIILRIETVTDNVSEFKHFREVETREGETVRKIASMKKTMYSLYVLAHFLKASNRRYLEFISTFDDPSQGVKHLKKVSKSVRSENRI